MNALFFTLLAKHICLLSSLQFYFVVKVLVRAKRVKDNEEIENTAHIYQCHDDQHREHKSTHPNS